MAMRRPAFLSLVDERIKTMSTTAECKKKLAAKLDEAKGLHGQVISIDNEMDDLLARLTALSSERDRLAARHETLNDEAETIEEELDRLTRKERRKARSLKGKKRVHETLPISPPAEGDDTPAIAARFIPEKQPDKAVA